MTASSVYSDDSKLSRFDRVFFQVESTLNVASGFVILALVCLAATNVIGRKLLNAPLPGFIDWVEQFMAVFAFVGIAYCQREGGHIRMDLALGRLKGRSLWFSELLTTLLILLLVTALGYGSWHHFLRSLRPVVTLVE